MSARGPRRAQLTADQAGRVERARADLDDTRTADNPVDYPIVGRNMSAGCVIGWTTCWRSSAS